MSYYVFKYKVNNCTPNAKITFYKTLGLCCDLYNAALELKQTAYRRGQLYRDHNNKWLNTKKMEEEGYPQEYVQEIEQKIRESKLDGFSLSYLIKPLRNQDSRYKEVNSEMLHTVLERVNKTYDNFLSGRAKFPKFKSKRFYDSLEFKKSGWKLEGNHLYITGIGNFSLFLDRPIEGAVKRVILKRDKCNNIFACFVCEGTEKSKRVAHRGTGEIGIDPGLDSLLALSDGTKISRLDLLNKYYTKLSFLDRQLSKKRNLKKRGEYPSKRYKKQLIQRNKIWQKIVDIRVFEYHKIARDIVANNDLIVLGKSNIKNMMNKKMKMGKAFADAAIFQFKEILEKICKNNNRQFIYVDEKHTTQTCSNCGNIKKEEDKLELSDRTYNCNVCEYVEDRDINAAKNILAKGKIELSKIVNKDVGTPGLTKKKRGAKLKAELTV